MVFKRSISKGLTRKQSVTRSKHLSRSTKISKTGSKNSKIMPHHGFRLIGWDCSRERMQRRRVRRNVREEREKRRSDFKFITI